MLLLGALLISCATQKSIPERKTVRGYLEHHPSNVRSSQAWHGHNFMVGNTPILPTEEVPEDVLEEFVGSLVMVSGVWHPGERWRPTDDEVNMPMPVDPQQDIVIRGEGLEASTIGFALPSMKDCASIYLRSSEGWWLSINWDGSGSYGFGTGLASVEVKKGAFRFEEVQADIAEAFVKKPENAEEPYMAVSYRRANTSSAVEHRLAHDPHLLTRLFLAARANAQLPENEFDARALDQVESFWRTSPWKENPHGR